MQNIHIRRLANDPQQAQGYIEPEDRSWQIMIDKDGVPHLWLRTKVEVEPGKMTHGFVSYEDAMKSIVPDESFMTIADIMNDEAHFSDAPPPEEETRLRAEYAPIGPCPKM